MDVLKQQIEVYKQYWLKALSEIDEEQLKIYGNGMSKSDLISKITNGALDIQDFVLPEGSTDAQETAYKKLVEGNKNAQSAYQDVEDTEKKLDDTEQDIADHQKERYEKRIEQIEAENDALKSRQDIIQADLDLLEASGGIELEGMYQELIDLSKQQMSLYEEVAAAARDRMSEVEAGSTEYYQLESKINDCTQSIKECQKEQAEWQETIKRLPIERIQKYINLIVIQKITHRFRQSSDAETHTDSTFLHDFCQRNGGSDRCASHTGLIRKSIFKVRGRSDKSCTVIRHHQFSHIFRRFRCVKRK